MFEITGIWNEKELINHLSLLGDRFTKGILLVGYALSIWGTFMLFFNGGEWILGINFLAVLLFITFVYDPYRIVFGMSNFMKTQKVSTEGTMEYTVVFQEEEIVLKTAHYVCHLSYEDIYKSREHEGTAVLIWKRKKQLRYIFLITPYSFTKGNYVDWKAFMLKKKGER